MKLCTALLTAAIALGAASADAPKTAVDTLLAADRAFSAASAKTDVVAGLSAMFADDVVMPLPNATFAEGREAAIAGLRANPDNLTSRLEWTPARAAISADGEHGFTAGFMTLHRADGSTTPLKYLAYWVKQPGRGGAGDWRVMVYKRVVAAAAPASVRTTTVLPDAMVAPSRDAAAIARHKESLDAAERAFSNEAQQIGLGPAFAKYGSGDSINLGGRAEPELVRGAEAIGRLVGADEPATGSRVAWAPDRVIVASSGDLGVTIGRIRRNVPVAGQPDAFPFFTVWRRPSPSAPWRYIAE